MAFASPPPGSSCYSVQRDARTNASLTSYEGKASKEAEIVDVERQLAQCQVSQEDASMNELRCCLFSVPMLSREAVSTMKIQ